MRNIRRLRSARCARPLSFLRNEDGSTAIEFGLIALPFMLFVLAILCMGLYFLVSVSLEHGAEAASRKIRTGQVESNAVTVGQFRNLVCQNVGPAMAGSTGKASEAISKYSGAASEVVLVTLCYRWDLANNFKFLKLGSGANGSGPAIIQAATAFKSEPYN